MNINNSVLDYIRFKTLNGYGQVQIMDEGRLPKRFGMVSAWKMEKGKTSIFMGARGYNRNERWRGIDNLEWVEREWRRKTKLKH